LFLMCVAAASSARAADEDARDAILRGVKTVGITGSPGTLCVFGDARAILAGDADGQPAAVAAAGTLGGGRVVVIAHNGYFGGDVLKVGDTGQFLLNAVDWTNAKRAGRVATTGDAAFRSLLQQRGHDVRAIDRGNIREALAAADVVVADAGRVSAEDAKLLEAFVRDGGGVVLGLPGWGWKQLNPGKSLADDLPANRLLAKAGIAFADGHAGGKDGRFVIGEVPPLLNASAALDAVTAGKLDPKDAAVAAAVLVSAAESLPAADMILRPKLDALVAHPPADVKLPKPDASLKPTQVLSRVVLSLQLAKLRTTPVQQVTAHPAAEFFPGAVPADAPKVPAELAGSLKPGRNFVGVYALAGQSIFVTLPPGAEKAKLRVRIGAHSDSIAHLKEWKRAPRIDLTRPLDAARVEVRSAFGGLVYVESDQKLDLAGPIRVEGGVAAPRFVLGQTSADEWKRLRASPAPWGELAGNQIILTLPSYVLRELDDPTELMRYWDQVSDACADLAARPRERERPERYCADVQISAGYMHSGYPIMTHLDAAPRFVDLNLLREKGDWGMFHEIGHNHQSPLWTFEGTGEVTNNVFTLYCMEVMTKKGSSHPSFTPEAIAAARKKFVEGGRSHEAWKKDPFLALTMYKQLRDAFGWEPYKKVFAEYRDLPADQRPKTEQDKRDQWLIRMSRATGKNLGPFFDDWGVPVTEQAKKQVAELPVWMPADGR
jgi:hypothetical protein